MTKNLLQQCNKCSSNNNSRCKLMVSSPYKHILKINLSQETELLVVEMPRVAMEVEP